MVGNFCFCCSYPSSITSKPRSFNKSLVSISYSGMYSSENLTSQKCHNQFTRFCVFLTGRYLSLFGYKFFLIRYFCRLRNFWRRRFRQNGEPLPSTLSTIASLVLFFFNVPLFIGLTYFHGLLEYDFLLGRYQPFSNFILCLTFILLCCPLAFLVGALLLHGPFMFLFPLFLHVAGYLAGG